MIDYQIEFCDINYQNQPVILDYILVEKLIDITKETWK